MDLSVDDHTDPIGELRRIFNIEQSLAAIDQSAAALEKRDYDAALVHVERAVRLNPNDPSLLMSLGFVSYLAGKIDAAVQHFRAARQRHSSFESSWENYKNYPPFRPIFDDASFVKRVFAAPKH